jgi:hypothetical protein
VCATLRSLKLSLRLPSYIEMALHGPLDSETRENLVRSHAASKVRPVLLYISHLTVLQGLLFTINDLLVSKKETLWVRHIEVTM